jgi:hypothetical protein
MTPTECIIATIENRFRDSSFWPCLVSVVHLPGGPFPDAVFVDDMQFYSPKMEFLSHGFFLSTVVWVARCGSQLLHLLAMI